MKIQIKIHKTLTVLMLLLMALTLTRYAQAKTTVEIEGFAYQKFAATKTEDSRIVELHTGDEVSFPMLVYVDFHSKLKLKNSDTETFAIIAEKSVVNFDARDKITIYDGAVFLKSSSKVAWNFITSRVSGIIKSDREGSEASIYTSEASIYVLGLKGDVQVWNPYVEQAKRPVGEGMFIVSREDDLTLTPSYPIAADDEKISEYLKQFSGDSSFTTREFVRPKAKVVPEIAEEKVPNRKIASAEDDDSDEAIKKKFRSAFGPPVKEKPKDTAKEMLKARLMGIE